MSYEEKGTWLYLAIAVVIPAIYFPYILGEAGSTPVSEIAYVVPLLTAIGGAIVAAIAGRIFVEIARPSETYKADARDKDIARLGANIGGGVLGVAMAGVLMLVIVEVEYFWIANAMYAAFVAHAIVSSIVKLIAYRRGL